MNIRRKAGEDRQRSVPRSAARLSSPKAAEECADGSVARHQTSPAAIFLCFSRNICVPRSERLTRTEEYAILISSLDEEIVGGSDRIAKRKLPRTAERGVWQRLRPACRELLPVAAGGSLAGRPRALSELSLPSAATAVKEGASSCYSQSSVSRRDTPNTRMSP